MTNVQMHKDGDSRWAAYFNRHLSGYSSPLEYLAEHWAYHQTLYGYIKKYVPAGGRILEVGCGPSASGIYLAACGYRMVGIDNDSEVLDVGRRLVSIAGVQVELEKADAFHLEKYHGRFDCVFSMGVLEHFDPEETVQLLREQAKIAPVVFFNIPSKHTDRTDERVYSPREMSWMVRQAGLRPLRLFGYGRVMKSGWHKLLYHMMPAIGYSALVNWFGHAMNQVCIAKRD